MLKDKIINVEIIVALIKKHINRRKTIQYLSTNNNLTIISKEIFSVVQIEISQRRNTIIDENSIQRKKYCSEKK